MHQTVVTCKIKHLQNICKNVLVFYFTCNQRKTFTKHLQKMFRGVTCKIKHFYDIFTSTAQLREVNGSKTFLQMFYFTCNHGLTHEAAERLFRLCSWFVRRSVRPGEPSYIKL